MKKLLFILLAPVVALACDFPVPEFQVSEFYPSAISHSYFDQVMDRVEKVYRPIFAAHGCPLVLHRSWSNGEVNAQAWQENGECHVEMFGGFARYPKVTGNTMIQVACHEIGHHLGGFPFYSGSPMSTEGQADYFSTADCMKRVNAYSVSSSLTLAKVLAELGNEAVPSRNTRSTVMVRRTLESHPPAQCRLDTFDAARVMDARPRCWFKP